jgi:hypothetical protein
MTTIMPKGENIRKAVRWISERRKESSRLTLAKLVKDACAKFDLSPKEANYLTDFFTKKDK